MIPPRFAWSRRFSGLTVGFPDSAEERAALEIPKEFYLPKAKPVERKRGEPSGKAAKGSSTAAGNQTKEEQGADDDEDEEDDGGFLAFPLETMAVDS